MDPEKMRPTTSFRSTWRGLELPQQGTAQGADKHRVTNTDLPVGKGRGLFWWSPAVPKLWRWSADERFPHLRLNVV